MIGCDAKAHQARIFSAELTPDVEVAEAVRISMSIPFFFEAQNFSYPGQPAGVFVDGGTIWNYPINFFDDKYPAKPKQGEDKEEEKTFGAHFDAPPGKPSPDANLIQHIQNIAQSAWQAQNLNYQYSPRDQARSISIKPATSALLNLTSAPATTTISAYSKPAPPPPATSSAIASAKNLFTICYAS